MRNSTILTLALLLIGTAWAQTGNVYHEVEIVDERGVRVTTISSVHIYAPSSTTDAVIYSDRGLNNTITIPMTTTSDNTTLVDGRLSWYGPDGYNFSITDGTNIATNANHRARTSSEGTLVFPSYITAISSTTYSDAMSAVWGTSPAFTQSIAGGVMTFTPGSDNTDFVIGVSGTDLNSDFNVFVGSALGLKLDAGDPSLTWDGGAVLINHNSSFNVGINTGTSTANTTIGSDTGGAIALDTTAGITVNADDSYALTVSAGTIGIASTGGDTTIDATDKSVIIRGTEEAADAILLDADGTAGGIELQCGTGDITLDSGDDIFLEANTGTGDVISAINTKGTSTSSIVVTSTVGGIDLDSALSTWITSSEEQGDAIYLHASGTAGGVDITSGTGDIVLTSTDDIVLTNATAAGDMIQLLNTAGTSVTEDSAAIQLTATAGGIIIQSDAAINGDTIVLRVDGGVTNDILLHNDQGTGADCINLLADAGGITLTADGATAGDILIDAEDDIQLTATGKVTITNTEAVTISGALTMTGLSTLTGINQQVVEVGDNTAYDVLAANSGKVHVIPDLTGDLTMDLPAEAAGLYYEFVYVGGAEDAQDWIIDSENNTNFFTGGLMTIDDDDHSTLPVYSDNSDDSICKIDTPNTGTVVKIWCDGTIWFMNGTVVSGTDTAVAFSNL